MSPIIVKLQTEGVNHIKKKNDEKCSRSKNIGWFRQFILHYKFLESAESCENFVLLADENRDYQFSELSLVLQM